MNTVGFWTLDGDVSRGFDIALVKQSEVDYFREVVAAAEVPRPGKLYVVAPNGYGGEDILAHYVKYKNRDIGIFEVQVSESYELRETLILWDELVIALRNFDCATALFAIRGLKRGPHKLATRAVEVLGLVEEYATECLAPIADHALFSTANPYKTIFWWQQSLVPLPRIVNFCRRATAATSAISQMQLLGGNAEQIRKRFSSMGGKSISDKFYDLSAFCIGLSERQFIAKRFQSAFLLGYRALDLYFQSVALATGVMIEIASGVTYRYASGDRVYLVNTEFRLASEGKLLSDIGRKNFIGEINGIRNQMLMTHGGHSVTALEVRGYLDKCRSLVTKIEGNSRWTTSGESFFPSFPDHLELLFALIPDIHTYVEEQAL